MLNPNDERTINANVDEVLTALRRNLTEHKEIVEEARKGYRIKCEEALTQALERITKRLSKLHEGGALPAMDHIMFNLAAPQDHSKEFDTIIKMLELHKNAHEGNPSSQGPDVFSPKTPATIALKASDVQRFVLNDWSWMDNFLTSNATYSGKSRVLAAEKGLI